MSLASPLTGNVVPNADLYTISSEHELRIYSVLDSLCITQDPNWSFDNAFIPGDRDLTVYARTLVIAGPLDFTWESAPTVAVLPMNGTANAPATIPEHTGPGRSGRHVLLFARTIIFTRDTQKRPVRISVDGERGGAPDNANGTRKRRRDWVGDAHAQSGRVELASKWNPFASNTAEAAADGAPGANGTDGGARTDGSQDPGANGGPGGTVVLLADHFELAKEYGASVHLSARGGDGGAGQDGQGGQDGQDGGDGACEQRTDGTIWYSSTTAKAAEAGRGGPGGWGGRGAPGGDGGHGGEVRLLWTVTAGQHGSAVEPQQPQTQPLAAPGDLVIDVGGGAPGPHGEDGEEGAHGQGGLKYSDSDGNNCVALGRTTAHTWGAPQLPPLRVPRPAMSGQPGTAATRGEPPSAEFFATYIPDTDPTFFGMLLQQVKMAYLTTTPRREEAEGATSINGQVDEPLDWLCARLEPVHVRGGLGPDVPTGNLTPNDVEALRAILSEAIALRFNRRTGLDLFGQRADFAPSLFFTRYLTRVATLAPLFAAAEKRASALLERANDVDPVAETVATLESALTVLQKEQTERNQALAALLPDIDKDGQLLRTARETLRLALNAVEDSIRSHFDVKPDDLVAALTQVIFVPPVERQSRGAGVENVAGAVTTLQQAANASTWVTSPWGAVNALVQAGGLIDKWATEITTADGRPVRKDLLIYQLQQFTGTTLTQLTGAVQQARDGSLSIAGDRDGTKLVAETTVLKQLLDMLPPGLSKTAEARTALTAYLTASQAHSDRLLEYNARLLQAGQIVEQIAALKARRQHIQHVLATVTDRRVKAAALAPIARTVYTDLRLQTLRALCLADRAYYFWALQEASWAHSFLALNKRGTVTALDLQASEQDFRTSAEDLLESHFTNPAARFPAADQAEREGALGIQFCLPEQAVTSLRQTGACLFAIPLPTEDLHSPFHKKANVRMTRIRAWVVGAVTADPAVNLTLRLTHPGVNRLQRTDGSVETILTEQSWRDFHYHPSQAISANRADQDRPAYAAACSRGDVTGEFYTDPDPHSGGAPEDPSRPGQVYTGLSPFTRDPTLDGDLLSLTDCWELRMDADDRIDRSGITQVWIDFWGFAQGLE